MPRAKVDLIKRTVCKEADDMQLALFLHCCEANGLDPFRKQVYAIFFNNDESRKGTGPKDMVQITGIDGFAMMAARDHKDFGGIGDAKFTWFEPDRRTPAKRRIPETATVTVKRKGGEPVEISVYWEEFAPKDLTEKKADFWNRMPTNQLEKCAQAKAYRRNFPGQGNVFLIQEMAQRRELETDGGRQIVDSKGFDANGVPVTGAAKAQHKINTEVDRQKEEASHTKRTYSGEVEVDYSRADDQRRPSVHCSTEALEKIQAKAILVWGKDEFWHVATGKDLGILRTVCDENNYEYIETLPTKQPPKKQDSGNAKGDRNTKTAESGKGKAGGSGEFRSPSSSTQRLVSGAVIKLTELKTSTKRKVPYMSLMVKTGARAVWMNTWDHNFFDWLVKAKEHGVDCAFFVHDDEKYGPQIVGLKNIGGIEFMEDGKTPIKTKKPAAGEGQEGLKFE